MAAPPFRGGEAFLSATPESSSKLLTQSFLNDLDGAVVVLDGLTIFVHVAQSCGNVIMGLSQQTTVWWKVFQLQAETLLEVL